MQKKGWLRILGIGLLSTMLVGCAEGSVREKMLSTNQKDASALSDVERELLYEENEHLDVNHIIEQNKPYHYEQGAILFSVVPGFYEKEQTLSLSLADPEQGGTIYFTTDGSDPRKKTSAYSGTITLKRGTDDKYPEVHVVRSIIEYPDGSFSEECTGTFLVNKGVLSRFSTAVMCVSGNPEELLQAPKGTLYGENAKKRGEETEREVYVELFDAKGTLLLSQNAGLRPYGGASRGNVIKSFKLYARDEYGNNRFKTDVFGTVAADGMTTVASYKKLVVRDLGNDFQFGYIRDEFNQRLAMAAGFSDYEAVIPVTVFVNRNYYGLLWMHENYCDTYFKKKYGDGEGTFVVLEGNEQWKADSGEDGIEPGDTVTPHWSEQYNETYSWMTKLDLRDEDVYADLCKFMDVENYLDYYAFQIYINNNDWPQNNYKLFRYVPAAGEPLGDGVFDGRWRYLLHDLDFCYDLYNMTETGYRYDNLKQILKESSNRYSPMFAGLMKREDCRNYFLNKMEELMNTVFDPDSAVAALNEIHKERITEHRIFQKYMDKRREGGEWDLWSGLDRLESDLNDITTFLQQRPSWMRKFLEDLK